MIESTGRIEPLFLPEDELSGELLSLAETIRKRADRFASSIHPASAIALREFVLVANAQYSCALEGNSVAASALCRAEAGGPVTSDIAEVLAHVSAERELDHLLQDQSPPAPTSVDFIRRLHHDFYRALKSFDQSVSLNPGSFRFRAKDDVVVGRHFPPASERVQAFMDHFEKRFSLCGNRPAPMIASMPAAHHRLAYIHPFLDGNGRVARLMTHAMAHRCRISSGGLWSISRALSRGRGGPRSYHKMMDYADMPRQSDRDGRGNLSVLALKEFSEWFLTSILEEIDFSAGLFCVDSFGDRFLQVSQDANATKLFMKIFAEGPVSLLDVPLLTGLPETVAVSGISDLISRGFLRSNAAGSLLTVSFPLSYYQVLFPDFLIS